jgi:hypothetical protein
MDFSMLLNYIIKLPYDPKPVVFPFNNNDTVFKKIIPGKPINACKPKFVENL